jgi:hypothetical protein
MMSLMTHIDMDYFLSLDDNVKTIELKTFSVDALTLCECKCISVLVLVEERRLQRLC